MTYKKQKKNYYQKGQALLVTMLILMASFLIGMVLGGLVLYELKSMIFTGESVKALYAAESGLEYELYRQNKGETIAEPIMINGTSFTLSSHTEGGYTVITSVGKSINTYRALEVLF